MSNIDKQAQRMRNYLNTAVISGVKLLHLTTDELSGLLDELEVRDKQVAELVTGRLNLQWILNVYTHAYEEAKEQIAKDVEIKARLCRESNSLFDRLCEAEKRIAELEARDKPKFVQCWSCKHDIEVLAIADCDGYCPRCAAPIDLNDEPYAEAGKGE